MNTGSKTTLIIPILVFTIGLGWLLTTQGIGENINWIWTLSIGVVGVLWCAVSGLDKVSVVVGPFCIVGSFLSVLRQTGRLTVNVEAPVLVMLTGVLLLISRYPAIPIPKWIIEEADKQREAKSKKGG